MREGDTTAYWSIIIIVFNIIITRKKNSRRAGRVGREGDGGHVRRRWPAVASQ